MPPKIKIAVMNTSREITDMLKDVLEESGYDTFSVFTYEIKEGSMDFEKILDKEKPNLILYDISIPYEENYLLFKELSKKKSVAKIPFVVTTTNKKALDNLVGKTYAYELIGKPYDLSEILGAVERALNNNKNISGS